MTPAPPAVKHKWPEMPYKGFSFYGPSDAPLFAGRERQVEEFATKVVSSDSRIVFLYGATGCGKSSFLRAGIIPFLERERRGFYFRKEKDEASKAALIRSTGRPLQKLAEEVYSIALAGYDFTNAFGKSVHTDLRKAVFDFSADVDGFVELVQNDPQKLVESLGVIAASVPVTPVLWIDQAEEVFSLGRSSEEEALRTKYFDFLIAFAKSQFPLKLIIAFRKEYSSDFFDPVEDAFRDKPEEFTTLIERFRLDNLSDQDLVRAIKRPTHPEEAPDYDPPEWNFTFEDNLPETIVADLRKTAKESGLVGGDLPILQVVCETLYLNTRDRGKDSKAWIITANDYRALGRIETQLNDYVDAVLVKFFYQQIKDERRIREVLLWKDVLTSLYRTQRDNSITSDLKTVKDLRDSGGQQVQKLDATLDDLLRFLADDEQSILRTEKVRTLGDHEPVDAFSLRHDAVGLVLKGWRDARRANVAAVQSIHSSWKQSGLIGLVFGALLLSYPAYELLRYHKLPEVAIGVGILSLLYLGAGIATLCRLGIRTTVRDFLPAQTKLQNFSVAVQTENGPILQWLVRVTQKKPNTKTKEERLAETRERLAELEEDPIFRLYVSTNNKAYKRYTSIREKTRLECGPNSSPTTPTCRTGDLESS